MKRITCPGCGGSRFTSLYQWGEPPADGGPRERRYRCDMCHGTGEVEERNYAPDLNGDEED